MLPRTIRELIAADGTSLMSDEPYYPWAPVNDEDWTLIAAAPDLLEALEGFLSRWSEDFEICDDEDCHCVCATARKAIAKATA